MLKHKGRSAILWSAGDLLLRHGLHFVLTIILARLLTPKEFGTIALLAILAGIAGPFIDAGFSSALIRKQDVTRTDESTVFWFNLLVGSVFALVVLLLAKTFAGFFKLPVLEPLVWLGSINIIISALTSVQMALLTKRLAFDVLTRINAIAILLSATVAIVLAWMGYGVWALAWQTVLMSALTAVLLWVYSPWRPAWCFDLVSLRNLFEFGGFLFASTLLNNIYNNAYTIIIGRFFKVTDLGLYQRAAGLSDSASSLLSTVIARVSFPLFSSVADNPERLKRGARLSLRGSMLINAPAMMCLCMVADPLILTLYGESWRHATPYLQILSIAGLLMPLHSINLNILLAQGHSRKYFVLECTKKLVGIVCLIGGAYFGGVLGVAWATLGIGAVGVLINSHYSKRHLGYGLIAQILDITPIILISLAMVLIGSVLGLILPIKPALLLSIQIIVSILTFLLLAYLFRLEAFCQTMDVLFLKKPSA